MRSVHFRKAFLGMSCLTLLSLSFTMVYAQYDYEVTISADKNGHFAVDIEVDGLTLGDSVKRWFISANIGGYGLAVKKNAAGKVVLSVTGDLIDPKDAGEIIGNVTVGGVATEVVWWRVVILPFHYYWTVLTDSAEDLISIYTGEPAEVSPDFVDAEIVSMQLSTYIRELDCIITVRQGPPANLTNTILYTFMFDENNDPKDNCQNYPTEDVDTMYTVVYTKAEGWTIERAKYKVVEDWWMVEDTNANFGLASSEPGGFSIDIRIPLTELPNLSEVLPWRVKTETFTYPSTFPPTGDLAPNEGVAYLSAFLGDLNRDGVVDIFDIVNVAIAFGSEPEDPDWNPVADLNNDDIVDIFDVVLLTQDFGKTA